MKNNLKVLMLAAELTPMAKVGGLGDVVGALPKAMKALGTDIRLCLPFYGAIDAKKYPVKKIADFSVPVGGKKKPAALWQTFLPGTKIPVYLVKNAYFNGPDIYRGLGAMKNNRYVDNVDDLERFAFYASASLEAMKKINFRPDVIHANDWHTGIVPHLIKNDAHKDFYGKTGTVYMIHNLANQGIAKKNILKYLNREAPSIQADLKNGDINFMVQGIIGADVVTAVSPTYAKEILSPEYGAGLHRVLKNNKGKLAGIINGIDTDFFNPSRDGFIPEKYSLRNLSGKKADKTALQKKLGLPQDAGVPLIGFVSRFVWQKGSDLITEKFSRLDCQFVFLGTGEKNYENPLKRLAARFPRRFSAQLKFDEQLAHEIYAGSDMFLVPSRFEPCGLTQMIAMRYGSVPIVRQTGGLADTVADYGTKPGRAPTGFVFKKFGSDDFFNALKRAIGTYKDKRAWRKLQANCMKADFSWNRSAKEYLKLYKSTLK